MIKLANVRLSGFRSQKFMKDESIPPSIQNIFTASDGFILQPNTDFEASHQNLIQAIKRNLMWNLVLSMTIDHDIPGRICQLVKKSLTINLPMPYYCSKRINDEYPIQMAGDLDVKPSKSIFPVQRSSMG